jgi:phosphoinositide-3-kinase regulatory subunit 4
VRSLLLPLLITCLNAPDWQLRSGFFHAVDGIGAFTGRESLDVFVVPCLEQVMGLLLSPCYTFHVLQEH